jgi:hypothetical protein
MTMHFLPHWTYNPSCSIRPHLCIIFIIPTFKYTLIYAVFAQHLAYIINLYSTHHSSVCPVIIYVRNWLLYIQHLSVYQHTYVHSMTIMELTARVTGHRLDYGRMVPSTFSNVHEVSSLSPRPTCSEAPILSVRTDTQLARTVPFIQRAQPYNIQRAPTNLPTSTHTDGDYNFEGAPTVPIRLPFKGARHAINIRPCAMLQLSDYDKTNWLPAHHALTRVRGHVIWISA